MTTPEATASPLLLVTIDRLPAGLLPALGCGWVAMPTLNELAARGVVLDRLIATSDDPAQVLAALAGADVEHSAGPWPLIKAAAAAGLHPAVITDDRRLALTLTQWGSPESSSLTILHVPVHATDSVAEAEAGTNLGRLFSAATACLTARDHRFVWVHAGSLGEAWDAPEEYRAAYIDPDDPAPPPGAAVPDLLVDASVDPDLVVGLRHVLAGQLTLLDHCLSELIDATSAVGRGYWTILVVGVRGLGLGLHGRVGCGPLPPFSELIQMPAVLVDHRGRMAAQRFGGLVIPADLAATMLQAMAHLPSTSSDPRRGRSLGPLLDDWQGPGRDRVICTTPRGVAVVTPAWHLVVPAAALEPAAGPQQPRLYAKPDDFFECSDVANRCPTVLEELVALAATATADPASAWTSTLSEAAQRGM
jgi:hypothetical protein